MRRWLLQGNCVRRRGYHHIDMFHSHFTHSCHKGCCIKKSMSYALWMVIIVSLSVYVRSQSSPINVYICFTDLTLSYFSKKPSLIQLPETMCFASATIKLLPFHVETLQPAETPTSLSCWNLAAYRDPNQHFSLKMRRVVRQSVLLSKNVQSSQATNIALQKCTEKSSQDPCPAAVPWASKLCNVFQASLSILHAETTQTGLPGPHPFSSHYSLKLCKSTSQWLKENVTCWNRFQGLDEKDQVTEKIRTTCKLL